MPRIRSAALTVTAVAALAASAALAGPAAADSGRRSTGVVYEATNAATGNAVQVFDRAADGTLTAGPLVPTGGLGAGNSLGSQGGLVRQGRTLLIVNGGDNTVSSLTQTGHGLVLRDVEPSGGVRPVSVTVHGTLVYVVHAGDASSPGSISGLRLSNSGDLRPIPGSNRALSAADSAPGQIQFTTDGGSLVVTEKNLDTILTYRVGRGGLTRPPVVSSSAGTTPFGFDLDRHNRLYVSEAATESSSSYRISSGRLVPVSPVVASDEPAPCWLVLTTDGRFAYTANAGGPGSISSYTVGRDGSLTLLAAVAASPGAGPTDLARSSDGRFLFVRVRSGAVASFAVNADGSLTGLGTAVGATSIGSSGLAAS